MTREKVLTALLMTVIIFILLNLTFLFVAGFVNGSLFLYKLIISKQIQINTNIFLGHLFLITSIIIILVISWFIFKSKKIKNLYKATFFSVPLATIFVILGMFLYQFQLILYIICFLIFLNVLYYFHKNKLNWKYYYTLILISLILLIGNLTGMEI